MNQPIGVLLVDDDAALGSAVRDALCLRGYDVEHVPTVEQGFDRLREKPRHVVLLDLALHAFRGEALVQRLQRIRVERPAIVIFSALPADELRVAMNRIGAVDIVQKPATIEEIVAAIERASGARAKSPA
ncbi:MAG TPA: response regulator [Rudaea sp.]